MFSTISFSSDDNHIISKSTKQHEQNNEASDPCQSTSGIGQQGCAQRKLIVADKKLNSVYKALLAKLPEIDGSGETERYLKKRLVEAQRAWIKYRDANCEYFGDYHGGAPVWRSVENLNCHVEMTKTRTEELQKYFDD